MKPFELEEFSFEKSGLYGYMVYCKGIFIGNVWSDNIETNGCEPSDQWEADETERTFSTKELAADYLYSFYKSLRGL